MRFDHLPLEMILKIAAACEPNVERELKYTSQGIFNGIDYYGKDRRCFKISLEKFDGTQSLSVEVVTPKFRIYGPYTKRSEVKKSDRLRMERFSSVEHLSIEGYDALSMFNMDKNTPALRGFTRLGKISTISMQNCPMDYSTEWCDQIKKIIKHFAVENLEVGAFPMHGVALPVAESINMLDTINGNLIISYSQRTPSYYDDGFLMKLVAKPRNRLCLGAVSTQFTFAAVLRAIKTIFSKGWKGIDWNLGSIELSSKEDFKKFKEHRKNLIDFAKKQLNIELKLQMDCHPIVPPYHEYVFTDEKNGNCIKFGTENVVHRSSILFDEPKGRIVDEEVFVGFSANIYML